MKKVLTFFVIIISFILTKDVSAYTSKEAITDLDKTIADSSEPIVIQSIQEVRVGRFIISYDVSFVNLEEASAIGQRFVDIDEYFCGKLGFLQPISGKQSSGIEYYKVELLADIPNVLGRKITITGNNSYIQMNHNHIVNNGDAWFTTAAHEYFHAIMNMYGIHSSTNLRTKWLHESFATWAGLHYFDSYLGIKLEYIKDKYDSYYSRFNRANVPLDHYEKCNHDEYDESCTSTENHQYHSFIFPQYIEQKYGLLKIREILEEYKNSSFDPFEAIDIILRRNNSTLSDTFINFSVDNLNAKDSYSSPSLYYRENWDYKRPLNEYLLFEDYSWNNIINDNCAYMQRKSYIFENTSETNYSKLDLTIDTQVDSLNLNIYLLMVKNNKIIYTEKVQNTPGIPLNIKKILENYDNIILMFVNSSKTTEQSYTITYSYQKVNDYKEMVVNNSINYDYIDIEIFPNHSRFFSFTAVQGGTYNIKSFTTSKLCSTVYEILSNGNVVEVFKVKEFNLEPEEIQLKEGKKYIFEIVNFINPIIENVRLSIFNITKIDEEKSYTIDVPMKEGLHFKFIPISSEAYTFLFDKNERLNVILFDSKLNKLDTNSNKFNHSLDANKAYYIKVYCSREYKFDFLVIKTNKILTENKAIDETLLEQCSEKFAFFTSVGGTFKIEIQSTMPISFMYEKGKNTYVLDSFPLDNYYEDYSYPFNYVHILECNADDFMLFVINEEGLYTGLFTIGIYNNVSEGNLKVKEAFSDVLYQKNVSNSSEVLLFRPTESKYYRIEAWSDRDIFVTINGIEKVLRKNDNLKYPSNYKYYLDLYFSESKVYIIEINKTLDFNFTINSGNFFSLKLDPNLIQYHFVYRPSDSDLKEDFSVYLVLKEVDYENYTVLFDYIFVEFLAEEGHWLYELETLNFFAGLIIGADYNTPKNSIIFDIDGVWGDGCIYYSQLLRSVSVRFSEEEFMSYLVLDI